jgi:hypothetical protein
MMVFIQILYTSNIIRNCIGLYFDIVRDYARDKLYNLLLYIDHSIAYSLSGLYPRDYLLQAKYWRYLQFLSINI